MSVRQGWEKKHPPAAAKFRGKRKEVFPGLLIDLGISHYSIEDDDSGYWIYIEKG